MSVDWNWFYSSLSQSAAAIVGIFGAFIITKIFSNQTVFHEKKAKHRDLLIQAQKISDAANSYNMEWYNKYYNRAEYSKFHNYLEDEFPNGESQQEVTDGALDKFIKDNDFSIFTEKDEIKAELRFIISSVFKINQERREQREAAYRAQAEFEKSKASPFGGLLGNMASIASMAPMAHMGMPGYSRPFFSTYGDLGEVPWEKLNKLRDNFNNSYREAKHHSRLSVDFLASIKGNPESPRQIAYALMLVLFIFFVGVIYPLSFMPAAGAPTLGFSWSLISEYIFSFKGFLLGVISVAFSVIVALFFNTHMRMKYPQADIDEVEKLTKVAHYCDYFKFVNGDD